MQQYRDIFEGRIRDITGALDRFLNQLTNAQILWIVFVLAMLCVLLLVALAARGRKHQRALDAMDKQADEMIAIQRDAQERVENARRELKYKANILDGRSAEIEELRRFYGEYRAVADAKAEALRMIAEAQDYAQDVKGRAEREYTEVLLHAQTEAKAIREMAEAILSRSHETLRHALSRSEKIIGESESRKPERPSEMIRQLLLDLENHPHPRDPSKAMLEAKIEASEGAPDDDVGSLA